MAGKGKPGADKKATASKKDDTKLDDSSVSHGLSSLPTLCQ